jgi:preprotein translocase subunit SecG
MVLYYLLSTVYVLVCILLLMVILLQQGKGDMAAAFGGGGSQSAFGARGGATLLSKATAVLAGLFMLGALTLAIVGQRGSSGSIMTGTPAPPASVPALLADRHPVRRRRAGRDDADDNAAAGVIDPHSSRRSKVRPS